MSKQQDLLPYDKRLVKQCNSTTTIFQFILFESTHLKKCSYCIGFIYRTSRCPCFFVFHSKVYGYFSLKHSNKVHSAVAVCKAKSGLNHFSILISSAAETITADLLFHQCLPFSLPPHHYSLSASICLCRSSISTPAAP